MLKGGLLGPGVNPKCPNDGSALEQQEGTFALNRVMNTPQGWMQTDKFFSVIVFRCPACGLLQIYDET